MKQYYVYFLTNKLHSVLYTGVTSNLEKRLWEHREKIADGFTKKYSASKLVYFECYSDPENAIKREKQIKNWARHKKDFLVNKMNPGWVDLTLEWYKGDPSASAFAKATADETLGMTER